MWRFQLLNFSLWLSVILLFLLQQLFQREADLGIYQADCEAGLQDPRFVPRAVTFDDNNLVSVADEDGEDTDADASWEEDSYQETGDLEEKQVRKLFVLNMILRTMSYANYMDIE